MAGRPIVRLSQLQVILFTGCVGAALAVTGCSVKQTMPNWMKFTSGENPAAESVEIDWETSFAAAASRSQETGKPMLMWFTGSDWCSWCIKLDNEVFRTREFQQWSDESTVPLVLDFPKSETQPTEEREQNEQLKQRYSAYIRGYPTVIFVSSTGTVIGQLGYVRGGAKNWIEAAENVLKRDAGNAIP